jgi:hypothetical protein
MAAAVLLAVVPFLGTLGHAFTYDDGMNVANPLVAEHRFGEILTRPFHVGADVRVETGAWRPLTTATFALNHAISGDRPASWHAANIALHAATTAALFLLAVSLGLPGSSAFVVAALFAVHPVHAEVVANVSNRTESLHAVFFLAALAAYVAWGRGRRIGVVALPLLAAALLSKETAVTFVAVAGAVEWALLRRPGAVRRLGAVAGVIAAYLVVRRVVLGGMAASAGPVTLYENPVVAASGIERLATALGVIGRGAKLLVWPHPLVPDYGYAHTVPGFSPWSVVGAALVVVALAVLAVAARRRAPSLVPLAILLAPWFLVSNLALTIGTVFGERLLYLPSAGFLLLVARHLRMRAAIGGLLLAGAAWSAWSASAWRDDFTLFSRAERSSPDSVRVLVNLGGELAMRGDLPGAERRLRRAVELAPELAPARINLGAVLMSRGDGEGALREARRALELDPGSPAARRLLEAAKAATSRP